MKDLADIEALVRIRVPGVDPCVRPYMLICMRTTIDISDALAAEVRKRLARQGSDASLCCHRKFTQCVVAAPGAFTLKDASFTGSTGFVGGVGPESALADMRGLKSNLRMDFIAPLHIKIMCA